MSGPEDGKYQIRLAIDPKPLIGIDGFGFVEPVITEGNNNVWNVKKLPDGNYTLTLEAAGRLLFIQEYDGKLVGSPEPRPSIWSVRGQEGGSYTIEVPSGIWPSRGWSVSSPSPKSPVTISIIDLPMPNQRWNFIPL